MSAYLVTLLVSMIGITWKQHTLADTNVSSCVFSGPLESMLVHAVAYICSTVMLRPETISDFHQAGLTKVSRMCLQRYGASATWLLFARRRWIEMLRKSMSFCLSKTDLSCLTWFNQMLVDKTKEKSDNDLTCPTASTVSDSQMTRIFALCMQLTGLRCVLTLTGAACMRSMYQ